MDGRAVNLKDPVSNMDGVFHVRAYTLRVHPEDVTGNQHQSPNRTHLVQMMVNMLIQWITIRTVSHPFDYKGFAMGFIFNE